MRFYPILKGARIRFVELDGTTQEQVVGESGFMFSDDDLLTSESPLHSHVYSDERGFALGSGFGSRAGGCLIVNVSEIRD